MRRENVRLIDPPSRIVRVAIAPDLGCVLTDTGTLSCFGQVFYDRIRDSLMEREVRCDELSSRAASTRCYDQLDVLADTAALRIERIATGVTAFAVEQGVVCFVTARGRDLRCRVLDPDDAPLRVLDDLRWSARVNGRAIDVCAAGDRACALDHRGKIWCWGDEAVRFSLLDDPLVAERTPQNIAQLPGARAISCESQQVCVLDAAGAVHCAALPGLAVDGSQALEPQRDLPPVRSIQSASTHTCAQGTDGSVHCWGSNTSGGLGTGDLHDRERPTPVPALYGATVVALGTDATCAIVANQMRCAGDARYARFGGRLTQNPRRFEVISPPSGSRALGFDSRGLPCVRGADGAWSCARLAADEAVVSLQSAFGGARDVVDVRYGCLLRESGRLECGARSVDDVVLFDAAPRQAIALDRSGGMHRYAESVHQPDPQFRPLPWRGAPVRQVIATGTTACVRSDDGRLSCDSGGGLFNPRPFRDFRAELLFGSAGHVCARQSTGPLRCASSHALRYSTDAESLPDPGALDVGRNRNELCALEEGELACTAGESRFSVSNVSSFRVSEDAVCARLRDGSVQCSAAEIGEWMVGPASFIYTLPRAVRVNAPTVR